MSLEIKDLNVFLGGNHVLKDINLEIYDGEFFCLLGSSGCGKSTLLKTIAGLEQERGGEILNGEKKLHCLPPQKRGVVIMFQDKRLFGNMSVGENVAFALRSRGVKKRDRVKAADKYLELVQLPGFGERRVHELSGGQQQRVALARALAAEPDVLMLDEPFSALDKNLRDAMRLLVKRLHDETGVTTIMVTHDQDEALSISDRIAVMSEGEILQVGTPSQVYTQPASFEIAQYFSNDGRLSGVVDGGVFTADGISFAAAGLADGPAMAIVRKNNISLDGNGVPLTVDAVLYRGQQNTVVLRRGSFALQIEVPLQSDFQVGQTVEIGVDWDRVIKFSLRDEGIPAGDGRFDSE